MKLAKSTKAIISTIANLLPPLFVCVIVATVWTIYVQFHLVPMSQLMHPLAAADIDQYRVFVWHTAISQLLTAMILICFLRLVFGNPGIAPDESEWLSPSALPSNENEKLTAHQRKGSTGERRFCKWCQRYKPDRCHHCRVCNKCVLRMDHHCPWVMNCIGVKNHKFFFLLLVYTALGLLFIILTMSDSVERSVNEETPHKTRSFLVLGLVASCIIWVLTFTFLSFHTWLMLRGMTTIEFCEKTLAGKAMVTSANYSVGYYQKIKNVLGPYWWLWLIPVSPAEGTRTDSPVAERTAEQAGEPEWTGQEDTSAQESIALDKQ